jgi:hypothetical protein
MGFNADELQPASSRTVLAPLQSCARFCLLPEVYPLFLGWLKKEHARQPPEFFDPALVREDIEIAHDGVGLLEEIASREG